MLRSGRRFHPRKRRIVRLLPDCKSRRLCPRGPCSLSQAQALRELSLSVVVGPRVATSAVTDRGPRNDKIELPRLLMQSHPCLRERERYDEKGHDAEWVHDWCREKAGMHSWIPPQCIEPMGRWTFSTWSREGDPRGHPSRM